MVVKTNCTIPQRTCVMDIGNFIHSLLHAAAAAAAAARLSAEPYTAREELEVLVVDKQARVVGVDLKIFGTACEANAATASVACTNPTAQSLQPSRLNMSACSNICLVGREYTC